MDRWIGEGGGGEGGGDRQTETISKRTRERRDERSSRKI